MGKAIVQGRKGRFVTEERIFDILEGKAFVGEVITLSAGGGQAASRDHPTNAL